ncbi:MAG: transcriptional activator RfaH [Pseudomonadota bacterium]
MPASLAPASADGGAWYLARLKPGGLETARTHLTRQGFTTLMPMQTVTRRRAGRLAQATRPLFPGYLFVQVADAAPRWQAINATRGVAALVSIGSHLPTPVPAGIVAALAGRTGAGAEGLAFSFAAGDPVRVIAGAFAETLAKIEAVGEGDRIFVIIDMMGRAVRTALTACDVERA